MGNSNSNRKKCSKYCDKVRPNINKLYLDANDTFTLDDDKPFGMSCGLGDISGTGISKTECKEACKVCDFLESKVKKRDCSEEHPVFGCPALGDVEGTKGVEGQSDSSRDQLILIGILVGVVLVCFVIPVVVCICMYIKRRRGHQVGGTAQQFAPQPTSSQAGYGMQSSPSMTTPPPPIGNQSGPPPPIGNQSSPPPPPTSA